MLVVCYDGLFVRVILKFYEKSNLFDLFSHRYIYTKYIEGIFYQYEIMLIATSSILLCEYDFVGF